MEKFIRKAVLFSLPFLAIIALYFVFDPFKVLYQYDSYFDKKVNGTVFLNTDYVATANFDNRYPEEGYNSFIFGNSRAWFYRIADWQKYIGNEPAYHFDAAGETLYAMHKKFLYLDTKDVEIKNALIILDQSILSKVEPKNGHLGIISPQLVGYQNNFDFHVANVKGFLNVLFLYGYLDYKISGKLKRYMYRKRLIESRPFTYDPVENELSFYYYDSLIQKNRYYLDDKMEEFYERKPGKIYSQETIFQPQKVMLEEMAQILRKHNTDYRIIISPLYNQEYLAKEDLDYLNRLFGSSNVCNFSGVNSITEDFSNYYEKSHYRPPVADKLMRQAYRHDLRISFR